MDFKDKNNKKTNFIKKEGFYVILFVCLCIVATFAAVTSRSRTTEEAIDSAINSEIDTASDSFGKDTVLNDKSIIDGALEVKKNGEELVNNDLEQVEEAVSDDGKEETKIDTSQEQTTDEVATEENKTVAVTSNNAQSFINPVVGTLARAYSEVPVFWNTTETSRPNFGIDIVADLDTDVVAVIDGEVQEISQDTQDGVKVVLYHPQSDLRTVYSNLNKEITLNIGDKIKQGDVVGKIGGTTVRGACEDYGNNFLHFEVMKGLDEDIQYSSLDPLQYLKY
ncbi:peptidoglycan DD-metalloendopeptidase family protein [Clostridium sp. DL1XJH146]